MVKKATVKVRIRKINKATEKKNEWFKGLTPAQRRVAIATDILDQVKKKVYVPTSMHYLTNIRIIGKPDEMDYSTPSSDDYVNKDVQTYFGKIKSCDVCALGSCLMSATKFMNELKFGDVINLGSNRATGEDYDNISRLRAYKLIKKLFGTEQLYLIEMAFEGNPSISSISKTDIADSSIVIDRTESGRAIVFKGARTAKSTMIAIMKNIIKNEGTFRP